jgi:hypothetical protein
VVAISVAVRCEERSRNDATLGAARKPESPVADTVRVCFEGRSRNGAPLVAGQKVGSLVADAVAVEESWLDDSGSAVVVVEDRVEAVRSSEACKWDKLVGRNREAVADTAMSVLAAAVGKEHEEQQGLCIREGVGSV